MTPGNYRYGDQANNSDLGSVRFQIFVNDITPPSVLTSVEANFSRAGVVTQSLPATIINGGTSIFEIDEVAAADFTLDHGSHNLTVTCTFADLSVETYISTCNSVNVINNPL